ncbi:outer membrane protein [Chenggangzhangella methanolivorans]|uniref:Porin family protein n=1 Tax=Chenggangzhangella methanolivorans TaxID=1437009 RepID=A0A9E6UGY4_9HYPH|nr:outer membrane protein [Chenggangzhangella methanolivorans]QZN99222.1 porin family protein [Chenggangzhangella methanolivorans]
MFRKIWLSGAAALMTAGAAQAADMPSLEPVAPVAVPSFSWSGAYVGVQGGYDWFKADARGGGVSPTTRPEGFTIGGYAGYNHQFDGSPLVLGAEADINYSDARDSRVTSAFTGLPNARLREEMKWTGAVRGRLGYAFDRFLVYGAAGVAFADRELSARGAAGGSDDTVAVGWTIGGGVEAALTDNVTARVEYRYSDYGADTFSVAGTRIKSEATDNRVLLGLGYKFSTGW